MVTADIVQSASLIFGAVSGFLAFRVYRRNARLERARWVSEFYSKFYEKPELKIIREQLDCAAGEERVAAMVKTESPEFTDYLNFFELMAYLMGSKQVDKKDIEAIFGYYLDCLSRHPSVVQYIQDGRKGYEHLRPLVVGRTRTTQ